jgi:Tol biopolymer transport system component
LMQVTSDSASEGYAIWSPDGKTIAYLKDRVSWLIPVSGGKPQKISSNFYHPLAFSSDSQWLIGNPRSGRELWFYNTTDAREFKMTLPKSIGNFLSISPNGRSLLFYNSSFEYKMALKIVSASGGPSLELGKNLSLYPFYQYWSADSKMIVSRGEKSGDVWDLWILPISNDKPFPLELNISIEKPIEPYSLSPDRKMLLFSVPQSDKLENLWVVPISLGEGRNTGPASKIFSGFEKRRMGSIYDADWSPDGKKLAICNKGDIWITSIQAEDPIKLTTITEQIYSPSWSPDGKWIAYLVSLGNKINIKIISTSDGRVNTVLENFIGTAYGWSPDGKELAFGSEGFIESYSVDNSTIRKIADLKNLPMAKAYNLCWSPDGEMLAFTDWRKAVHASSPIFTVPSKGGEIIELTTYDTDYWNWKGYVFWSPDGKWISYNHDGFVKIRPEGSIWEADFAEILDKLSK